jgi:hypothetical protein
MKDELDKISDTLSDIIHRLYVVILPKLTRKDDIQAVKNIITDLTWAEENCTVIGLHQIGQALDDTMGITN